MYGEVTQQNLHLFIPGKAAGVAMLMSKETGRPALEMLRRFYATRTCKLLEKETTKYWHYSSSQLYEVMKDSVTTGCSAASRLTRLGSSSAQDATRSHLDTDCRRN